MTRVRVTSEKTHWFARIALAPLASSSQAMMNVPVGAADLNYLLRRTVDWMERCGQVFGTLVARFPFNFVDPGPKCCIVTAVLESSRQSDLGADGGGIPEANNTKNKESKK
jgi:hypothetical protein